MLIKNANKIAVPAYLNEEFFVNTLEEGLRETKIKLHEINIAWGSNPGENYCSAIYRVGLTFERENNGENNNAEQLSVIVKTIPITPQTQFLEDVGVFIKEKLTYCDVLPKLEILCKGDEFGARMLYAQKLPVQTIVFNDLKTDGFIMASRQDCLDWNHSLLILQQLAKLHASSMVLAKKIPSIVGRYRAGMLSPETIESSETFEKMFGGNLSSVIANAATWPGYEAIAKKMQRFRQNFKGITSKLAAPKPQDKYTVLNHGDLWTNNFMFAYGDASSASKPTKAIFVDFQLSFFGSPACDINFFLNTSVRLDVLQKQRSALIECYYSTFAETLNYMRYEDIPSLNELKSEIRSRELYGLFGMFGFLPMVTMPSELSADSSIETMSDADFQRKKLEKIFGNPKLIKHLQYSLKYFDDLGVLDEF